MVHWERRWEQSGSNDAGFCSLESARQESFLGPAGAAIQPVSHALVEVAAPVGEDACQAAFLSRRRAGRVPPPPQPLRRSR